MIRTLAMKLTLAVLSILAMGALTACNLPNPYEPPPSSPVPPPSGEPPAVPTQPESQTPPPAEQQPERPTREYQLGAASRALVAQAQTQAANGDFATAAGSIERALRIEPSNPLLWLELGKLRQQEGNFAQAESLGRKALSLATGDARAQSLAWGLIAESLRARGRAVQAREAEQRAAELQPR